MKKLRTGILLVICLVMFSFWGKQPGAQVQAASRFNVLESTSVKTAQKGKWVKNYRGYRFRSKTTGKYIKNTFAKIKKHIYYFDRSGYIVTGVRKYRGGWYYFDERGRLGTGWRRIRGNRYYFSKRNAQRLKGWNKIGTKKFYFDNKGVLQTNRWVKGVYVNEKGFEVKAKRIFIGDSRTVELSKVVKKKDVFIAKYGRGYKWFAGEGLRHLKKELKANPYSAVIFNLGINDLYNVDNYLAIYKRLIRSYPRARFYFVSINPVEETLMVDVGYPLAQRNNARIEDFNIKLMETFPDSYIDCNKYLTDRGFVADTEYGTGTIDGLHYTDPVYRVIYRFVTARVH